MNKALICARAVSPSERYSFTRANCCSLSRLFGRPLRRISARACRRCKRAPGPAPRQTTFPRCRGRRHGRSGAGAGRARSRWPWTVCGSSLVRARSAPHLSACWLSRWRRTWPGSALIEAVAAGQSLIWVACQSPGASSDASSSFCRTSFCAILLQLISHVSYCFWRNCFIFYTGWR